MAGAILMDEHHAKKLLEAYSIARPWYSIIADNTSEIGAVKRFPVVAKILSDDLPHKTDAGAVQLNIDSPQHLQAVVQAFRSKFPGKSILVEEQIPHDFEFILGVKKDAVFGHVIMFGAGGIFTEVYRDAVFRKPPITREEARKMTASVHIGVVFEGFRNRNIERERIVDAILSLSDLIMDRSESIAEMEINPLVCLEDMAIALDAKIVLQNESSVSQAMFFSSNIPRGEE